MNAPAKIIIADDERVMREQLITRLAEVWPEAKIIAEATNGKEAVDLTNSLLPNIIFLDIRMPILTGLEAAMQITNQCIIVFVTAFDQYAISAFEQGAIDYLLKPVSRERLLATVTRLQQRLSINNNDSLSPEVLAKILSSIPKPKTYLNWIQASVGERLQFIASDDILFFQAADKYTRVVHKNGEALIRTAVCDLSEQLDPDKFWQIHRATLVNITKVSEISRNFKGLPIVSLQGNNEKLNVSRTFAWRFKGM